MSNDIVKLENKSCGRAISDNFIRKCEFLAQNLGENAGKIALKLWKGEELGLSETTAITEIDIINGSFSLRSDLMLAIVQSNTTYEYHKFEKVGGDDMEKDEYGWKFTIKLKNREPHSDVFTVGMAKKADLLIEGKKSSWTKHLDRMLKARAKSFALRDYCTDLLHNIYSKEEMQGVLEGEVVNQSNYHEQLQDKKTNLDVKEIQELKNSIINFVKTENIDAEIVSDFIQGMGYQKLALIDSKADLQRLYGKLQNIVIPMVDLKNKEILKHEMVEAEFAFDKEQKEYFFEQQKKEIQHIEAEFEEVQEND